MPTPKAPPVPAPRPEPPQEGSGAARPEAPPATIDVVRRPRDEPKIVKQNERVAVNWQPLIDVAARWGESKTFTWMALIVFAVALFGSDRVAGWLEAIGAEALLRIFSGGSV